MDIIRYADRARGWAESALDGNSNVTLAAERNPAMDGIRGLAVLIVFLSHTSGRDQAISPALQFHGIGHVGVYLFFVLSGFLLADHLIVECQCNGRISLRSFLIRRVLRIAPLYFLIVTAVFLWQQMSGSRSTESLYVDNGWAGYIKHLLFVAGDGVFWTIPAEFTFYLVLPFFVLLVLRQRSRGVAMVAAVAMTYFLWFASVQLWNILPKDAAPKLVEIRQSSQYLDVFLCGVLAAYLRRTDGAERIMHRRERAIDAAAIIITIFTLSLTAVCVSHQFLVFKRPYYDLRWYSIAYGIIFAFIVVAAHDGYTRRLFEILPLRLLGIVGFSWYLIHLAVFAVVNQTHFSSPEKFLLSTVACTVSSATLYVAVERPFIRLGKRLTRKEFAPGPT